ncbi:MAG: UvrD-helicase domain-containing protein [Roseiflexus sp.]|nr:UvrD-helicase domain-containing protein [Roseiflexus sp.]MCS7289132.1 UvrD-helicase domain-containing protein [Roseiflexus sp.]MDW8233148.1 UvrD-helicase domain-containing protein [Roseiflexaceae bacterium]
MSVRWQHIRALARDIRRIYLERAGSAPDHPLPLDDLAETLWSLTVVPTTTLAEGIQGKVEPELQVIRVRRDLPPTRLRFVVAHEIGHVALEGLTAGPFRDTDDTLDERAAGEDADETAVRTYNTRERREREANLFALELLVPAEDLWQAVQQPDWSIEALAAQFAVSSDAIRAQLANVCSLEPLVSPETSVETRTASFTPDPEQQAAVDAPLPVLLVAGPGTGKTRSIVAKYVSLVRQGIDPASILALTFSNRAAEEMRERIIAALRQEATHLAGRVEVSTFHSWGLNVLRIYGARLGLPVDARLLDTADLFMLLSKRLNDLRLEYFKDLREPTRHLLTIIQAISRIKDELWSPEEFAHLAEAEAQRLVKEAERDHPGTTRKATEARERAIRQAAALRELAKVYPRYEAILRDAGALDYGDLIVLPVKALRDHPAIAADLRRRYRYLLIDEFQDINYASGELIRLLDGGRGQVWAVGDAWQSIYRFRGASAANLDEFTTHYPNAHICYLTRNYRSLQPILDASAAVMARDPHAAERPPLVAQRNGGDGRTVIEWVVQSVHDEYAAIAHDILRRVRPNRRRLPGCAVRRWTAHSRRMQRTMRRPALSFRRWRFRDHAILCRTHEQAGALAAVLEAHGIPVDHIDDVFDAPEVKDALAVCAQVGATNSAGLLRALTMPEHCLDSADLNRLVDLARRTQQALPRAARDPQIVAQLSAAGQQTLTHIQTIVESLEREEDAWQVLTAYLFRHSQAMRERLVRAARGDIRARRELAVLGQLLAIAHTFVRTAEPDARSVLHFTDYIRALRAAGVRPRPSTGKLADAVQVMTVHAAKGLEFPIVYVPGLQEGRFPARGNQRGVPLPNGLIRGPITSEEHEERYLLYVAMTRARDRLVLSRALTHNDGKKPAERSSLLPGDGQGNGVPWRVRLMKSLVNCPAPTLEMRLHDTPLPRMPLPASSIDLDGCKRRFLYQYVYQLYDDLSPFLRMHQAIRECVKTLTEQARDRILPPDEASLRTLVFGQLQRYELDSVLYADDYAAETLRHIKAVWEDLRSGRITPAQVDRKVIVRRPAGTIEVRIDREETQDGVTRWVWVRPGMPRSDDHLAERVMLYALARHETADPPDEIAIAYTGTGETRHVTPSEKVLANHATKIDRLLESMRARRWAPSFGPQCDACPFNLICPV